jgi:hypothetical protein
MSKISKHLLKLDKQPLMIELVNYVNSKNQVRKLNKTVVVNIIKYLK